MPWVPTVNALVVNVATPVALEGATVAVKVTLWPDADGLTELVSVNHRC